MLNIIIGGGVLRCRWQKILTREGQRGGDSLRGAHWHFTEKRGTISLYIRSDLVPGGISLAIKVRGGTVSLGAQIVVTFQCFKQRKYLHVYQGLAKEEFSMNLQTKIAQSFLLRGRLRVHDRDRGRGRLVAETSLSKHLAPPQN